MIETKTRLREDQERVYTRVADTLGALTDEELREVERVLVDIVLDRSKDQLDSPVARVWRALADLRVEETNYRLDVVWAAEADLMGGHRVDVDQDGVTMGLWRAFCCPTLLGELCWEGPERKHREDAIEDGRRHNPGHEPGV
ncbi:MAG TPA: hypothetical protein VMS99_10135 [Acidimicrobiia bacterium]|nr:hypothetical protein [Acidimicrobiia bacterium]